MSGRKMVMIVNPHGGLRKGRRLLEKVQPVFDTAGVTLEIHETQWAGHARELARELDLTGLDGFCAIGGDGTLHELMNGMLERNREDRVPIGMIAGGSGNSFMATVELLDPIDAANAICSSPPRSIDVARVETAQGNSYICNIIGWGLVTDIGGRAEQYRWTGTSRYTIATVIEVLIGRNRTARLVIDGEEISGPFSFILACNTQHTGKGMRMAPKADLSDGLIDLVIVRKAPRLQILRMLPKVFDGSHLESPLIDYRQVKAFELYPDEPDPLNFDGEIRGTGWVKVEMVPAAFEMYAG